MSQAHQKKTFVVVDGSSYLFRAFYALPELTNRSGQQTGAILGVINMLRRLLKDYKPEYMAVVFDPKGKNFRHELYPDYKANRAAMPCGRLRGVQRTSAEAVDRRRRLLRAEHVWQWGPTLLAVSGRRHPGNHCGPVRNYISWRPVVAAQLSNLTGEGRLPIVDITIEH